MTSLWINATLLSNQAFCDFTLSPFITAHGALQPVTKLTTTRTHIKINASDLLYTQKQLVQHVKAGSLLHS